MDFHELENMGILQDLIAQYFDWRDLFVLELVSRQWHRVINDDERVWRAVTRRLFRRKAFVPALCWGLVTAGNTRGHREDLARSSVAVLRGFAKQWRVDLSQCVEKSEMIALLHQRQILRAQPNECLARFALRLAYGDRERNCITREELCATEWCIRLRGDGGLANLTGRDPWWHGQPPGRVTFRTSGALEIQVCV
jgi:hypothetical protein